jgi:hypothetical protein
VHKALWAAGGLISLGITLGVWRTNFATIEYVGTSVGPLVESQRTYDKTQLALSEQVGRLQRQVAALQEHDIDCHARVRTALYLLSPDSKYKSYEKALDDAANTAVFNESKPLP